MTRESERRLMRRLHREEDHRIVSARLRPGHRARLIDVSAGGALIETNCRLLPGSIVELHMETPTAHAKIRGRVLRSSVASVRPSFVCYRGAICFDRHLPWFVEDEASGSPDARPSSPGRTLPVHEEL